MAAVSCVVEGVYVCVSVYRAVYTERRPQPRPDGPDGRSGATPSERAGGDSLAAGRDETLAAMRASTIESPIIALERSGPTGPKNKSEKKNE